MKPRPKFNHDELGMVMFYNGGGLKVFVTLNF